MTNIDLQLLKILNFQKRKNRINQKLPMGTKLYKIMYTELARKREYLSNKINVKQLPWGVGTLWVHYDSDSNGYLLGRGGGAPTNNV